jgi:hypothetical protein
MPESPETLVGRPSELLSLDLALGEFERKRPAALSLVDEPGIGKTRARRAVPACRQPRTSRAVGRGVRA